jgi:hypothetical protein
MEEDKLQGEEPKIQDGQIKSESETPETKEEPESEWISHLDIDYNDDGICQIHVDTRDFSCLIEKEEADFVSFPPELSEEFVWSKDEVKKLLEDLFVRSGGKADWRMLVIIDELKMKRIEENNGKRNKESIYAEFTDSFWELKYIRIYKYEDNFVVCTKDDKLIKKCFFQKEIDKNCLEASKCCPCKTQQ